MTTSSKPAWYCPDCSVTSPEQPGPNPPGHYCKKPPFRHKALKPVKEEE